MKKNIYLFVMVVVLVGFLTGFAKDNPIIKKNGELQPLDKNSLKVDLNFGKFPLYFIANKGQVNKKARFYANASRYTLWLTKEGLIFDSAKRESNKLQNPNHKQITNSNSQITNKNKIKPGGPLSPPRVVGRDVSRLLFVGANKNPEIMALKKAELKVNYFIGSDRSKWHGDVPTSLSVLYKDIYRDIDLKVYGIEKQIEYDWIVKPGADPAKIKFRYDNVKSTRIDKSGDLIIETEFGRLVHKKPVSYQVIKTKSQESQKADRQKVVVRFKKIEKNTYGFVTGDYDKSRELVIDPVVLAYSTYLGGGGDDYGYTIAVDSSGYVYTAGVTGSTNFPVLNQYQVLQSDVDAVISIIDPTKSGTESLLYSTYLGGSNMDSARGIAVDDSGHVYVSGYTYSTNFPTLNQYQTNQGERDGFITVLDPSLSGAASLLYSTYLGGTGDDYCYRSIAADNNGNTYITGVTRSTDFPTLNQYQTHQGDVDVFVTKIDTTQSGAASLLYSTYIGGTDADVVREIAADNSGGAYVTGYTSSTDFPTLNQYQADQLKDDAFVTKIDTYQTGASSLLYSTYLGGAGSDYGYGITVDNIGNAYVTGFTYSVDFPTLNQYQGFQGTADVFVTKIDTTQSGAAALLYSTYIGGASGEYGRGIAADNNGRAYVTGYTYSSDFPTFNLYQGFQGVSDAFVTNIDTTQSGASSLLYSTCLGGKVRDWGYSIAVDNIGNAYVTGGTKSSNFPTVNQYQTLSTAYYSDIFITKLYLASEITVTAPNGGERWQTGSLQNITWDTFKVSGLLRIVLLKDGITVGTIANDVDPASGSYAWTVGQYLGGTAAPGTGYTIKIKQKGTTVVDSSDASFSIASLELTSPNGAESWGIGATQNITWNSPGVTGFLKITLWKDGVAVGTIANDVDPAAGSYAWTVGQHSAGTAAPGTGYTIKIREKGTTITDNSETPFTLLPPITVTAPNGGESWQISASQNITWDAPGVSDLLKITLWKDGVPVGVIANGVDPAAGSYTWEVGTHSAGTAAPGSGYTVKIKEKGTTVSDGSDAPFALLPPITVTAPNGGESWQNGTSQNITWNAPGVSGLLKITLWKDGVSVGVVANDVDPAAGSYTWTVGQHATGTAPEGSGYTIKIREKGTTEVDASDSSFSLTN
ncbi:MAG: SBBP repeat-containing protein [Candidatus Aminicenantes bacterium]|nr:SBBP repeat-containing protein [Candidatus Aminicenantes bacterium]